MKKLSILLLSLPAIWFLARRRKATRDHWGKPNWDKPNQPEGSRAYLRELERWYQAFLPVLEASCDEDDAHFLKWRLTRAYGPIEKAKAPVVDSKSVEGEQK
jgi:hypothetical protein